ncbi:hypothetical protein [Anaerosporobacter sp.]|uniref:hypothetical protein n=1 Tax=Anaerosporobacter sp. TaxID=1872529 RepID=UPI00286F44E3|nr:hypothetical protein [Anaerosporobacter sp.]
MNYSQSDIISKDINRPGIQLTGYLEHYNPKRVQVLGYVENIKIYLQYFYVT